jgi:serine/threonine protein phosphatase PrpC
VGSEVWRGVLGFNIEAFGISHPGKVRTRNEDAMAVEPGKGLVVVADGMGGAPSGHIASAMAVQETTRSLHRGETMRDAYAAAHARVKEMAESGTEYAGMGTTLTALKVDTETGTFVLGHVGDSRAYHLSQGILFHRTTDHTLVRSMVDQGKLPASAERDHPMGHILTRAVGIDGEFEPQIVKGALSAGDRFLLCSDGLVRVFEDEEIGTWLRDLAVEDMESSVEGLVDEANERGAPDNVTVALLVVGS